MASNNDLDLEIQRLTTEVQEKREFAEFWDTWNIRLLAIAGFAALFLVITAIGVSRSNRDLLRSSDDLERAKDRKLQADFKVKDEKIAEADRAANEAKLELARFRAPRVLNAEQQKRIAAKLIAAGVEKGQHVMMRAIPLTTESKTLAEQILAALRLAPGLRADWFMVDDIGPMTGASAVSGVAVFFTRDPRSVKSAHVLTEGLKSEGITAHAIGSLLGCERIKADPDDPYCFHIFVVVGPKQ